MNTLFAMLPKGRTRRKPFVKTQRWTCKRCNDSVHDDEAAYCEKFDLCIEFTEDGRAITANGSDDITCTGDRNKVA
jgi:hypothetical protein